jgi:hypothetical protein
MIRDFAIGGASSFRSDVDLVVGTNDSDYLAWIISSMPHQPTRFGGWRIRLDHWIVDVWPVANTWAFDQGHVHGGRLEDLPATTFFDWDAAAFEIETGRLLLLDGYIEAIASRVLDVNLAPNPNPLGMAVRALKMMRKWDASLAPRLSSYLSAVVNEDRYEILRQYKDRPTYQWLNESLVDELWGRLSSHLRSNPLLPFKLENEQLDMPVPRRTGHRA